MLKASKNETEKYFEREVMNCDKERWEESGKQKKSN
jgi:hypothetical protein